MRKMGAAGAAVGSVSIAGCSSENSSQKKNKEEGGKVVKEDLPKERKMDTVVHVSNTERYYAARYQANVLVDKWLSDNLGIPAETDPIEFTVLREREDKGDFDLVTYNWCANNGEPDSILVDRFHKNGSANQSRFDHDRYNEVAMSQRVETDEDARQDLVYEAQNILGEQRPETQYLYNENTYAYNTDRFEEDSVVVNVSGLRNIWNYTQIKPKNEKGKTIVTNNWDPSDQLNPLHINGVGPSRNWVPTRFMHDFLVRPDPNQQATGWAASEWNWSDETTVTFELKEGMTFHDGEPVTASDVKWTFDMIMETEPPAYLNSVVEVVESVETDGDYTVTFNLQDPYVPFILITAASTPILPEHYWTQLMEDTGNTDKPWNINIGNDQPIVASGPFQWGEWDQGSRFEMPAYKDHAFAAPNIDKRVQRPLSTRDAEMQAMINGDYDLLDFWFGDPEKLKKTTEEEDHLSFIKSLDDCRQCAWLNTGRPPFDDVAVRQATNAVVTAAQQTIINELYEGYGKKAQTPINPSIKFWHNPDTTYFDGGVEAGVQILADAGYVWDKEGNIYYPEGKTGK